MIDTLRLHAYIDGELSVEEQEEAKKTLDECSATRREYEAILAVREALRRVGTEESFADVSTQWKACLGRLDEIDRSNRTQCFVQKYAWAMAATVFGMIIVGGALNRSNARGPEGSDVPNMFAQLGPSQKATPQTTQSNRFYDMVLRLAQQDLKRIRVTGVVSGDVDGVHLERYTLEDGAGTMSMLVMDKTIEPDGFTPIKNTPYFAGQIDHHNCVLWKNQTGSLILVGDRTLDDLAEVVDSCRNGG
jgi:hypothetical protein